MWVNLTASQIDEVKTCFCSTCFVREYRLYISCWLRLAHYSTLLDGRNRSNIQKGEPDLTIQIKQCRTISYFSIHQIESFPLTLLFSCFLICATQ